MGFAINGKKGGTSVNGKNIGGAMNGELMMTGDKVTYIAEGERNSSLYRCFIYENNNGVKGELVEIIERYNWERLAYYAPKIEIALDNVCYSGTGVGVPLNFAKLKKAGSSFISSWTQFNQDLYFPKLEKFGHHSFRNLQAFTKKLTFQKGLYSGGNIGESYFLSYDNAPIPNGSTRILTLELRAPQTATSVSSGNYFLNGRANNCINLRINKDSGINNLEAKRGIGTHTFRSIVLIDEFGNEV